MRFSMRNDITVKEIIAFLILNSEFTPLLTYSKKQAFILPKNQIVIYNYLVFKCLLLSYLYSIKLNFIFL